MAYHPYMGEAEGRAAAQVRIAEEVALKVLLSDAEADAYERARREAGL